MATPAVIGVGTATAVAVARTVPEILSSLNDTVRELQEFCSITTRALNTVLEKYDSIIYSEIKGQTSTKLVCENLKYACEKFYQFVDAVDDIYYYGKNEEIMKKIREGIQVNNFSELAALIEQLQFYITNAQQAFETAMKACKNVQMDSMQAADDCKMKAQTAKTRKRTTRAIGGTLASSALVVGTAGGVAASVVAGVFTFGIGAIVGLSITAAVATVGGAGIATATGALTHHIASQFDRSEIAFREMSDALNPVCNKTSNMISELHNLETVLKSISRNTKNTECAHKTHSVTTLSISAAVSRLYYHFQMSYDESSQCRSEMTSLRDRMMESI